MLPERGAWQLEESVKSAGTTFFLPWASDPGSDTRLQLGASAVAPANIEQLAADFRGVLRKALLFLRRLTRAELRRNGKTILACDLERDHEDETALRVSFDNGDIERWLILRSDAAGAASELVVRTDHGAGLGSRGTGWAQGGHSARKPRWEGRRGGAG